VRGKVESLHSMAHAAPDEERQASAERARRYFRLALQYAVAGSQPLVLVVMGRIASGKSTLARTLGAELGWEVYSSDHLRKKMAGFPLYERSSSAARSLLYSPGITEQIYDRLLASAAEHLLQGHSIILDATFARRAHRDLLAKQFDNYGAAYRFLETKADDATVKDRLSAREAKPDEVSDARREDFEMLTTMYEPPHELQGAHYRSIPTTSALDETVKKALNALSEMQLESRCP
jgi:hypothetical protein